MKNLSLFSSPLNSSVLNRNKRRSLSPQKRTYNKTQRKSSFLNTSVSTNDDISNTSFIQDVSF